MKRRDVIKVTGGAIAGVASGSLQGWQAAGTGRAKKKVIVMGAGIAGLSCAYELVRRGHEVTVLEATGRPGGHVRTFHDQFADGLYADVGAEHFYYPGYTEYWRYLQEFSLTAVPYPRRDNMVRYLKGERYEEADLQRPPVLSKLGFNQKSVDFLSRRPWAELSMLYRQRYVDRVHTPLRAASSGRNVAFCQEQRQGRRIMPRSHPRRLPKNGHSMYNSSSRRSRSRFSALSGRGW